LNQLHRFPSSEKIASIVAELGTFHRLFIETLQSHFANKILTSFYVSNTLCILRDIYAKNLPDNFWESFFSACNCSEEYINECLEERAEIYLE
jgi:hypothetical protein